MKKHRYFVTTTKTEYYSDDEMAILIEKAEQDVNRKQLDNDYTLCQILRQDFGEIQPTEIFNRLNK